jgi:DNA-binding winged helix-turn-helix (wHTH) protein
MKYFLSYRFDEFNGALWRGGRSIDITRKAANVLRCLVERSGTVVSHDAILSAVWPDAHVQSDNIKVLVREIRRALEDDPRVPSFIRSEPGRGYSFIAPVSDAPLPVRDRCDAGSAIFINHADDLAKLAETLADAANSECRVVLVEGERGMGKTALCDAFVEYARTTPAVRLCYGQCLEHAGRAEPYFPIVDALDHLARQFPATVPHLLARHAPAWLAQLPPWVSDAAPSAKGASVPESSRLIRELSEFLETLAAEATTVMVLDDLQWGDLETIELLRGLARRHARLRTLIVATYAPFASTVPAATLKNVAMELGSTGRSVPVRLKPLTEEHVQAYLEQRFKSESVDALTRTVYRLTGGNPRALVSTMDGLIAGDYLVLEVGGWRSRHSARTLEGSLPDPILDVIFWRFGQLGPEDRVVLETAAAIGIEFCPSDVARAAGVESPIPIARRLDVLHGRGFIARRGALARASSSDEPIYRFLHPLHAELLARHAPVFQQLRAAERFAQGRRQADRFA